MSIVKKQRIESIDILRGLAMIIMALDHVRDYFHAGANLDDPLNLETTTPFLFFTRWITHFCAPVFVFLSGTSVYLQSLRKTRKELSVFLVTRGLWLILLEVGIVTFGWTFDFLYHTLIFQVIWAIGISMVILGLIIHLPFKIVVGIGIIIVLLHNVLDFLEADAHYQAGLLMDLLHHGRFVAYPFAANHVILIAYAFLPWTGLMIVGYGFGKIMELTDRKKWLNRMGISLIILFIILRFSNVYGDPFQWGAQKNGLYSFLSFIKVNKYPPSLLYMCMTIGPALLFLSFIDSVKNKITAILKVYGRVALFYYLLHLYIIHILIVIDFLRKGNSLQDAYSKPPTTPFYFVSAGEGYSLPVVYAIWIFVMVLLYPFCKWYDRYKTGHKEKWWLSYL